MTDEQRRVADEIRSGPRGGMRGPFEAWLRSVGMVDDTGRLTPFDLERSVLRSLTSAEAM